MAECAFLSLGVGSLLQSEGKVFLLIDTWVSHLCPHMTAAEMKSMSVGEKILEELVGSNWP